MCCIFRTLVRIYDQILYLYDPNEGQQRSLFLIIRLVSLTHEKRMQSDILV